MNMLTRIAWRNVWRNPRRSFLLIGVIGLGVFSFLGSISFMDGFADGMLNTAVDLQGGHIQVMKPGYYTNPNLRTRILDSQEVEQVLEQTSGTRFAPVVSYSGMVNSAEQSSGVMIYGIDPDRESEVTRITGAIVEGEYAFNAPDEVIIGAALAEHLDVRLGEKLVLMANDLENEVSSGGFRVRGIYDTGGDAFDKMNVYVDIADARRMTGYETNTVSGFSVRLDRGVELEPVLAQLKEQLPAWKYDVLSWRDRLPMVVMALEAYDYASIILVVIMFTAIAFTIINSFLMVIFERIREIGIMMANGVRPAQIRRMLYLEACVLVVIGLVVGTVVATVVMSYFHSTGIDLSAFSDTMDVMGMGTVIYPAVNVFHIVTGFISIVIMVLLAVFYPAYKASRFQIVEAINYV